MTAAIDPRIAQAFQQLRAGRPDEAERLCRTAINGGDGAAARAALARVFLATGRPRDALAEATRAATQDPRNPEAQMALADAALAVGDFDAALVHWKRIAGSMPGHPRALLGLARAAQRFGDKDLATRTFATLLEQDPRHPLALRGLIHLRLEAEDRAGAIDAARRVLELEPDAVDAWQAIALAHWQEHDLAPAMAALREVLSRDPNHLPARWAVANLPPDTLHADDAAMRDYLARYLDALSAFEALGDPPPQAQPAVAAALTLCNNFYLHYALEDSLPVQRRAGTLLTRLVRAVAGPVALPVRPARDRPRVLLVSCFLYEHSVGKLFGRVVSGLDRRQLEVLALQCGTTRDALTDSVAASIDGLATVRRDATSIRERILAEAPDVLVWLDIGMDPMLGWVAAQRLAPVQCALWGHPVTTGLDSIDWFLTADAMERKGGEADYSERVFRLPGLGCRFETPAEAPPARPARSAVPAVFGMPQTVFKLTPANDGVLARVAAAIPDARFALVPGSTEAARGRLRARIEAAFVAHGATTGERLMIHSQLNRAGWFALLGGLDVNLDPIGWSGGVTSFEVFWFDIPTVTLPGRSMRSRHTLGMLRLLELDHRLAARDLDDYVRIAVELGRSADLRAELRGLIAERKHRLYDDPRVSRALEDFLLDVAAGREPRPAVA